MSAKIEQLKKVIAVLESSHIRSVEVGFEDEIDDIRYYTAITNKRGEAHRYTVRVHDWFENGEKQTWAKCSCAAGAKDMVCRHVLAVSPVDAKRFNRDLHLEVFDSYKAHTGRAARAESVEECRCRFDWDDKFTELCPAHLAESIDFERTGEFAGGF